MSQNSYLLPSEFDTDFFRSKERLRFFEELEGYLREGICYPFLDSKEQVRFKFTNRPQSFGAFSAISVVCKIRNPKYTYRINESFALGKRVLKLSSHSSQVITNAHFLSLESQYQTTRNIKKYFRYILETYGKKSSGIST